MQNLPNSADKTVHIVYASTSGNVEVVAECIQKSLHEQNITTSIQRAEMTKRELLEAGRYFIFATSTWEHGELNPYFKSILDEMEQMRFEGKAAGFVGLGDTRYEPVLFCRGIEIVNEVWTERGGAEIGTVLKINGEPYDLLDTLVVGWAEQFVHRFHELSPTAESAEGGVI